MGSTDRCPWPARWWHRRLRRIDRAVMLPTLRRACEQTGSHEIVLRAAWRGFIDAEGQEHWRCPCAGLEERDDANTVRR